MALANSPLDRVNRSVIECGGCTLVIRCVTGSIIVLAVATRFVAAGGGCGRAGRSALIVGIFVTRNETGCAFVTRNETGCGCLIDGTGRGAFADGSFANPGGALGVAPRGALGFGARMMAFGREDGCLYVATVETSGADILIAGRAGHGAAGG